MTTIHISMDTTGDPGQIMSNFVKDIETSSFFTGPFALAADPWFHLWWGKNHQDSTRGPIMCGVFFCTYPCTIQLRVIRFQPGLCKGFIRWILAPLNKLFCMHPSRANCFLFLELLPLANKKIVMRNLQQDLYQREGGLRISDLPCGIPPLRTPCGGFHRVKIADFKFLLRVSWFFSLHSAI
jgi:hypothetical protein